MSLTSLFRLLALGAIWGGSFLFMRIAAPQIGPIWLVFFRIGGAALFMTLVAMVTRTDLEWRKYYRHYVIFGLLNLAIPFSLFALAAENMHASVLSVINATAAIWGAVIMAVISRTMIKPKALLGLGLGIIGVGLVSGFDFNHIHSNEWIPLIAGLGATFCYGLATAYAKRMSGLNPLANTTGSMICATVMLLPLLYWAPPLSSLHPSFIGIGAVMALSLVCSGVAFLIYFALIKAIGPSSTLSVAFLIPVFGVTWGVMILHEPFTGMSLAGAGFVMIAMALITGFNPLTVFQSTAPKSQGSK